MSAPSPTLDVTPYSLFIPTVVREGIEHTKHEYVLKAAQAHVKAVHPHGQQLAGKISNWGLDVRIGPTRWPEAAHALPDATLDRLLADWARVPVSALLGELCRNGLLDRHDTLVYLESEFHDDTLSIPVQLPPSAEKKPERWMSPVL